MTNDDSDEVNTVTADWRTLYN